MCLLVRLPLIKHHLVASLITEGLTTQRISNVYRCVCTDSFCRAQIVISQISTSSVLAKVEVKVGDLDFSNLKQIMLETLQVIKLTLQ